MSLPLPLSPEDHERWMGTARQSKHNTSSPNQSIVAKRAHLVDLHLLIIGREIQMQIQIQILQCKLVITKQCSFCLHCCNFSVAVGT